jgi:hypothetical protein
LGDLDGSNNAIFKDEVTTTTRVVAMSIGILDYFSKSEERGSVLPELLGRKLLITPGLGDTLMGLHQRINFCVEGVVVYISHITLLPYQIGFGGWNK